MSASENISSSRLEKLHADLTSFKSQIGKFFQPPKALGKSVNPAIITEVFKRAGGSILNGLGILLRGGAMALNKGLGMVTVAVLVIALVPGAVLGGGLAILGGTIGAIAGAIKEKKYRKEVSISYGIEGLKAGGILGVGLVLVAADLPLIMARLVIGGTFANVGIGFAKLGGASDDELYVWKEKFLQNTFIVELSICDKLFG